jgi:hypothetical protein
MKQFFRSLLVLSCSLFISQLTWAQSSRAKDATANPNGDDANKTAVAKS